MSSGRTRTCQYVGSTDVLDSQGVVIGCVTNFHCTVEISWWRSCGGGCKLEIGYCNAHGGIDKATKEMELHIAAKHPTWTKHA